MLNAQTDGRDALRPSPQRNSCNAASALFLAGLNADVAKFAFRQRLIGARQAYDALDRLLSDHLVALEEIRDELRPLVDADTLKKLDDEITYARRLGAIDEEEEE